LSFGATLVDPITGNVTPENGDFYFSVDITSEVSLKMRPSSKPGSGTPADFQFVQNVIDPRDPTKTIFVFDGKTNHIVLTPGVYHTFITVADNLIRDDKLNFDDAGHLNYDFELSATA